MPYRARPKVRRAWKKASPHLKKGLAAPFKPKMVDGVWPWLRGFLALIVWLLRLTVIGVRKLLNR